ncbi:MAG: VWA domain-containing protein [Acidobacteria bacterium]|nr:VWA domain-containing protein [Acidobacteriota bacterium]
MNSLTCRLTFFASLAILCVARSARDAPCASPGTLHEYVRVVDRPYQRVGLTVTVTDPRGQPVRGLSHNDFRVLEDGVEMAIQDFGVEGDRRDRPLSVAVLLDLSQSMGSQVKKVREAARALLTGLRPGDEIMVAKFNEQLTVLQTFTGDPDDPERTLRSVGRARGGTALFRAIEETLKDLRARPGRKVILVVTDGLDNYVDREGHVLQSLYLQDLLRLCFRSQTVVYGIRPGMTAASWIPFEGFVEETGGRLLYTGGDLERLFARLGEEFLSQYYLAYDIDPKSREGKRRRIRVEVASPDVVVKAVRGYVASAAGLRALLRDARHDDASLRADAAYELGFVDDPKAARALLLLLEDGEGEVRRLAVGALGRLGEEAAIPRLVEHLSDPEEPVPIAAAEALLQFGPKAIPDLVSEVAAGAGGRADGAGGGTTGPGLLNAARVLGRIGDDRAVGPLAGLLRAGAEEVRIEAARALGDLGLSEGIPPLRGALADPAPRVRGAALRGIVMIAGSAARAVVEDYMTRETDPILKEAARAALESL